MKQILKTGWWSVVKNNQGVVKLAVAFLLVGLAFRLLFSRSTEFPNVITETPFVQQVLNNPKPLTEDQIQYKVEDSGGECDLSVGSWVRNPAGPVYTNESCQFIGSHQNCLTNGRPDKGYLYWRWNPRDCELPQFDAKKFLEKMRNKAWALIGDSISRNHVQSLLCVLSQECVTTVFSNFLKDCLVNIFNSSYSSSILSKSSQTGFSLDNMNSQYRVEVPLHVYHVPDYKHQRWLFSSYNFTISVIWSPFLTKADIFEDYNGVSSSDIQLHLDVLDTNWTSLYQNLDYAIFSSGKWFVKTAIYYENETIQGCHKCPGKNLTELGFGFAYRKVIKTVFNFILNSNHKGVLFYRTSTPDHFENGEWFNGGSCERKEPAKEGEFQYNQLNRILREVELEEFEKAATRASEVGMKFKLLDVMPLSILRPDGHPGPYRYFQPFSKELQEKLIIDCLHWCLPGPIDSWNDLLMKMVVDG